MKVEFFLANETLFCFVLFGGGGANANRDKMASFAQPAVFLFLFFCSARYHTGRHINFLFCIPVFRHFRSAELDRCGACSLIVCRIIRGNAFRSRVEAGSTDERPSSWIVSYKCELFHNRLFCPHWRHMESLYFVGVLS